MTSGIADDSKMISRRKSWWNKGSISLLGETQHIASPRFDLNAGFMVTNLV